MSAHLPDVSVLIPAWNAEKTLGRAVESVLGQVGVEVEIIVVDDASEDDTFGIAKAYQDQDHRVRAFSLKQNSGPSIARNLALAHAAADFVTPLDSDDFMEPHRLCRLLARARADTWDFAADDLYKVSEQDIAGPRVRLWSTEPIGLMTVDLRAFIEGNLSSLHGGRGEMGFLKPLISKRFLTEHQLRYAEDLRLGEDYALYSAALACGARFCLTDPLGYVAVVRESSLSGQHDARALGALVQADEVLMRRLGRAHEAYPVLRRHYIETMKRHRWMRLIEAVKRRDLVDAAGCFIAPPSVGLALSAQLLEQIWLRSARRLSGSSGHDHSHVDQKGN